MEQYYCIEYRNYICTNNVIYKTKAKNINEAVINFFIYINGGDSTAETALKSVDNIDTLIKLFERLDFYNEKIVNIFTIGNWVYCTETEE